MNIPLLLKGGAGLELELLGKCFFSENLELTKMYEKEDLRDLLHFKEGECDVLFSFSSDLIREEWHHAIDNVLQVQKQSGMRHRSRHHDIQNRVNLDISSRGSGGKNNGV
jgi:hypothetical protein